jgi:hypothetical protein
MILVSLGFTCIGLYCIQYTELLPGISSKYTYAIIRKALI